MTKAPSAIKTVCTAILTGALAIASPAAAERLKTIWRLEPIGGLGPRTANFGRPFLEQRLVPLRLVKLTAPALVDGTAVPAGTMLFLVFNEDKKIGFCTIKDGSLGNAAKSLFIPALDRRPCFVDQDGDGRFDASFTVFDKYGSAATPSGSMRAAKPLAAPLPFEEADPHLYPVQMRISFALTGSHQPDKARVAQRFDKGRGYEEDAYLDLQRDGSSFVVGNFRVTIRQVTGDDAAIDVATLPGIYLTTDNPGNLITAPLPDFLAS